MAVLVSPQKAIMDSYWECVADLLSVATDKAVSTLSLRAIRELYEECKAPLIPLFGEDGRIVKKIEASDASSAWEEVTESYGSVIDNTIRKDKFNGLEYSLVDDIWLNIRGEFYPSELAGNRISSQVRIYGKTYVAGTKIGKAIPHIVSYLACEDKAELLTACIHEVYAQMTSLSKAVIKNRQIYVSINPLDILTASMHTTGWRSCHRLNGGEYKCGPMSYLLDPVSVVCFTADKSEDYYLNTMLIALNQPVKSWRQMAFIDLENKSAYMSRQYPDGRKENETEAEKIIASVLGGKSYVLNKDSFLDTGLSFGKYHYSDYIDEAITVKNGFLGRLFIGAKKMICPVCGEERFDDNPAFLVCEACNGMIRCADCGSKIHEDCALITKGGRKVCRYCASTKYAKCTCCHEFFRGDIIELSSGGLVCADCYNRYTINCHCCGKEMSSPHSYTLRDGELVCVECYQHKVGFCYVCGDTLLLTELRNNKGSTICKMCDEENTSAS